MAWATGGFAITIAPAIMIEPLSTNNEIIAVFFMFM